MILDALKLLARHPIEMLSGLVIVALLGLSGWLWVAAQAAEADAAKAIARATTAEERLQALGVVAQAQERAFRKREKESEDARQAAVEESGRALADLAGRLERLREQAAADRASARRRVPTVPAVDASLDDCRARVAAASRAADDIAARVEGVADRAAAVLESAGGADRNRTALIAFKADAHRCASPY